MLKMELYDYPRREANRLAWRIGMGGGRVTEAGQDVTARYAPDQEREAAEALAAAYVGR